MAINLREKRVKIIVGIVDGKEELREVDFDECTISDMVDLLEFSKGTYSHGVVTREFFNKVGSKCNPEEIAEAKRLVKKMRGEQFRISRKRFLEED